MKSKEKLGFLSLISAALIWGYAFISVEKALNNGWEIFPLLTIRFSIGALIMFIISFKRHWWKDKTLIKLGIQNGILFFCGFALQTFGQKYSSVPNSAFLTALNIIMVPIFLHFIFKKRIKKKIYIACFIAIIGAGFLSLDQNLQLHLGDLYLIMCAMMFAFHIIHNERCGRQDNTLSIISIQLITMAFLSLIFMPISSQTNFPCTAIGDVFYLGIFSSAIAGFLQMFGQKLVEASKASLILAQESVIATIFSITLLHEPLTLKLIIGGSLMILAVFIVEYKKN